jgi:hypothetical protein
MDFMERNDITNELRIIKTARDIETINEAARNGYRPLIKKVVPSKKIRSKYSVIQNKYTGEIRVSTDFRRGFPKLISLFTSDSDEFVSDEITVIDWTYYYPYNHKCPFAAYLIPKDIVKGERVFLEDLIEDYVGAKWNQGDTFRLESCEAVWNGRDFEIMYDPKKDRSDFIG